MTAPRRIQRRRTKGWRMPPNTVYVGRPTVWGNPIAVTETCSPKKAAQIYRRLIKTYSQEQIMRAMVYEDGQCAPMAGLGMIVWRQTVRQRLPELRGRNLACWCPLDRPCHADVLLELANA